ncbi:MAG TPA: biotin carboxylase N-terminal domain-containing protein, partial [Myxococcota bacterium]|nr:biotin carboxylase N-terminal domain-containing protein [Myxococcota bacterium]
MFRRLLIANRGEVAARVARTARRMGIEVVAVASAADRDQAWLRDVDHVVTIGPAPAQRSYLDQDALLEVARHTGCSAVHPGWGFLAENERFAARCEAAGVTFVGPSPRHLRAMGDKAEARRTMRGLGLDPIPGTQDAVADEREALREAERVGYPVLVKAVAGGGGKGMRRV